MTVSVVRKVDKSNKKELLQPVNINSFHSKNNLATFRQWAMGSRKAANARSAAQNAYICRLAKISVTIKRTSPDITTIFYARSDSRFMK